MAAALGGLDALVFTGGVGERSPEVRAARPTGSASSASRSTRAQRVGVATRDDRRGGAACASLVVEAREDLEIARGVRRVLGTTEAPATAAGCAPTT